MSTRKILAYPSCGTYEIYSIIIMFFHSGGNGQHVRVEDDVGGIETNFIYQQVIGSATDLYLTLISICLSLFVKSHHNYSSTKTFDLLCPIEKTILAFL